MGLRFFRRIRIAPGLTLNLSKSGGSLSLGVRGAHFTLGPRGARSTVGIPGTGIFYTTTMPSGGARTRRRSRGAPQPPPVPAARLNLGFFERLVTPVEERHFVDGLRATVQGDETKALGEFLQAAHLPDAAFLAGLLEIKRREYALAVDLLRAAAGNPELGKLCEKYGINAGASLPITEEISAHVQASRPGALLALVEAYQRLEQRQEAVNCLLELRENRPDDIVVKLSLAELLMDTDAEDPEYCREIVRMTPELENESPLHTALLLYKAKALRGLGMVEAAREVLTQALRRKKDRPAELLAALRYERALVYEALGRRAQARKELERIYAETPDYRDVEQKLLGTR